MKVLRESFYFEPRCVDDGCLRWYGEQYAHDALLKHSEETVYIRDSGSKLYIYHLQDDDQFNLADENHTEIRATFKLVCKIKKYSNKFSYGKKL